MPVVTFTVPGDPTGKGRPRFTKNGRPYTPAKTAAYEDYVKMAYMEYANGYRFGDDVCLDARVLAYYSIPKSVSKKKREQMLKHTIRPAKKPDNDNIIKIIFDSLNKIAYHDDAQIVDCQIRKFYAEQPRVVITITEAST